MDNKIEGYPIYQWSKFTEDRLEQFVVRSNDFYDFIAALDNIKGLIAGNISIPDNQAIPEPLQLPTNPPEEPETQIIPECPIHHVLMKERRNKSGQTWWDHRFKDDQDQWHICNGKKERVQS